MSPPLLISSLLLPAHICHAYEVHLGHSTITFAAQSQSLTLDQWFSALTLASAPLATHIAFGIAEPVLLSAQRPRLWDSLPHYTPSSGAMSPLHTAPASAMLGPRGPWPRRMPSSGTASTGTAWMVRNRDPDLNPYEAQIYFFLQYDTLLLT
jgi:hypothetical protein